MRTLFTALFLATFVSARGEDCRACFDIFSNIQRDISKQDDANFKGSVCTSIHEFSSCLETTEDCKRKIMSSYIRDAQAQLRQLDLHCSEHSEPEETRETSTVNKMPCVDCINEFQSKLDQIDYSNNRVARFQICSFGRSLVTCIKGNRECAEARNSRILEHAEKNLKHLNCDRLIPGTTEATVTTEAIPTTEATTTITTEATTTTATGGTTTTEAAPTTEGRRAVTHCYACAQAFHYKRRKVGQGSTQDVLCDLAKEFQTCIDQQESCKYTESSLEFARAKSMAERVDCRKPEPPSSCSVCAQNFYVGSGSVDYSKRNEAEIRMCDLATTFLTCVQQNNGCPQADISNVADYSRQVVARFRCRQPDENVSSRCAKCVDNYNRLSSSVNAIESGREACSTIADFFTCMTSDPLCMKEQRYAPILREVQIIYENLSCGITEVTTYATSEATIEATTEATNETANETTIKSTTEATTEFPRKNPCRQCYSNYNDFVNTIDFSDRANARSKMCSVNYDFLYCVGQNDGCKGSGIERVIESTRRNLVSLRCESNTVETTEATRTTPSIISNRALCVQCYNDYNRAIKRVDYTNRESAKAVLCPSGESFLICIENNNGCRGTGVDRMVEGTKKNLVDLNCALDSRQVGVITTESSVTDGSKCSTCVDLYDLMYLKEDNKLELCEYGNKFLTCIQDNQEDCRIRQAVQIKEAEDYMEQVNCNVNGTEPPIGFDTWCQQCLKNYASEFKGIDMSDQTTARGKLCATIGNFFDCMRKDSECVESEQHLPIFQEVQTLYKTSSCGISEVTTERIAEATTESPSRNSCQQCYSSYNEIVNSIDFSNRDNAKREMCSASTTFLSCVTQNDGCKNVGIERIIEGTRRNVESLKCESDIVVTTEATQTTRPRTSNRRLCVLCYSDFNQAMERVDHTDKKYTKSIMCSSGKAFLACVDNNNGCIGTGVERIVEGTKKNLANLDCLQDRRQVEKVTTESSVQEESNCSMCDGLYDKVLDHMESGNTELCEFGNKFLTCIKSNGDCTLREVARVKKVESYMEQSRCDNNRRLCMLCFSDFNRAMKKRIGITDRESTKSITCSSGKSFIACIENNNGCLGTGVERIVVDTKKNLADLECSQDGRQVEEITTESSAQKENNCVGCGGLYYEVLYHAGSGSSELCEYGNKFLTCFESSSDCTLSEVAWAKEVEKYMEQGRCNANITETVNGLVYCEQCLKNYASNFQNIDQSDQTTATSKMCAIVHEFLDCMGRDSVCLEAELFTKPLQDAQTARDNLRCGNPSENSSQSDDICLKCFQSYNKALQNLDYSDVSRTRDLVCTSTTNFMTCIGSSKAPCAEEAVEGIRLNMETLRCGVNYTEAELRIVLTDENSCSLCSDYFGDFMRATESGSETQDQLCDVALKYLSCVYDDSNCTSTKTSQNVKFVESSIESLSCLSNKTEPVTVAEPCSRCLAFQSAALKGTAQSMNEVCNNVKKFLDCLRKDVDCKRLDDYEEFLSKNQIFYDQLRCNDGNPP